MYKRQGVFDETADGQDSVHWAVGSVSIVVAEGKRYIQLNEDFNSGPLPDGHVYYSSAKILTTKPTLIALFRSTQDR